MRPESFDSSRPRRTRLPPDGHRLPCNHIPAFLYHFVIASAFPNHDMICRNSREDKTSSSEQGRHTERSVGQWWAITVLCNRRYRRLFAPTRTTLDNRCPQSIIALLIETPLPLCRAFALPRSPNQAITDGRDGGLAACHPLLLSCGLNMSVFYATVLDDRDKAANLAKTIHDNGAAAIRLVIDSATYQTSFATLRLLHANVVKWSDEAAKEERGRRTRKRMEEQQERRISAALASHSIGLGGSDDAASEGNDDAPSAASSITRGSRTSQSSSGSATTSVTASTTSPSPAARTKSGRRATELIPLAKGGVMLVDKVL